jgi:tetratricopeptide (TPR) repeat protein
MEQDLTPEQLQGYEQFWRALLQTGLERWGQREPIYALLNQNLHKLDRQLIPVMQQMVRQWGAKYPGVAPTIAALVGNLMIYIQEFPLGRRLDNQEIAIAGFGVVLEVCTRSTMPVDWAQTTMNLATAYYSRIRGDRAENIERAIDHYSQALTVRTQTAMPVEWARTTMNLANAYSERIWGERAENIERAIDHYSQALTVMPQTAMPLDWAQTIVNLANAYRDRIRGDRGENIERAIDYFNQALTVLIQVPQWWALTLRNLALAYQDRRRGVVLENLHQAIDYTQQALTVFTARAYPLEWAKTQRQLAQLQADPNLGEYGQAIQLLEPVHQRLMETKLDLGLLADVAFELADLYHVVGRLEPARLLLKDALRLYQRTQRPQKATATLATLGNLEMQLGQLTPAREHLQLALADYQAQDQRERIAEVEKLLGFLTPAYVNSPNL